MIKKKLTVALVFSPVAFSTHSSLPVSQFKKLTVALVFSPVAFSTHSSLPSSRIFVDQYDLYLISELYFAVDNCTPNMQCSSFLRKLLFFSSMLLLLLYLY